MNSLAGSIPARPQWYFTQRGMSTHSTQKNITTLLQFNVSKKAQKKINVLSFKAEFTFFVVFLSLALFTAVVALAHTLSFLASTLGGPLFTLLTPSAAVVFAALVPVLSNPVHALLCLLGLFAATALIYISLGAEYLGLVFTLVYLGAIAILFLYVIMLLNVKDIMSAQKASQSRSYRYILSGLVGFLLFFRLPVKVQEGFQTAFLFSSENTRSYHSPFEELTYRMETDILSLRNLYGDSWPLFMLITSILLIAMLGAIVLATGSVEEDKTALPSTKITGTTSVPTADYLASTVTINLVSIHAPRDKSL